MDLNQPVPLTLGEALVFVTFAVGSFAALVIVVVELMRAAGPPRDRKEDDQ